MRALLYILILALSISCTTTQDIKSGDIVFRGALSSNLSEAINDVTQTSKSTNYTHIGICDIEEDGKVVVYHSDLGKGVVKESLELFLSSEDTVTYNVDLYRIKSIESKQIESAISKAESLIGNPYNITYILEDEGYYCSEYIYELFKNDSVFKLEPMSFKNSETNTFHKGWIAHYKDLGIDIPEGKLGCNPNGMANSTTLKFIKKNTIDTLLQVLLPILVTSILLMIFYCEKITNFNATICILSYLHYISHQSLRITL